MNIIHAWIQEADVICVFRHQNPDADALGSQWGLVSWLQEEYPDKKIYAMGAHRGSSPELFGTYTEVKDEVVASSLAIILDTANKERIDDERYQRADKRIKIDHHPYVETYADYEFIDEHAASTSELVTELIQMHQKKALKSESARYLYMGILADTLRFSTRSTRSKTLEAAAFLVKSHLNLGEINDDLFALDQNEFEFANYIRSHAIFDMKGIVYIVLTQADLASLNISQALAKEKVNELGLIRSTQVWAMFIEQEPNIYNGSLRSRHKTINDIARRYHGGGHKLAAAVKGLDLKQIEQVISEIKQRILEDA